MSMCERVKACRQREEELRQSRQECWALQQDLTAVRGKLAGLKTTMEDRRKDLVSYKVQLPNLAAGALSGSVLCTSRVPDLCGIYTKAAHTKAVPRVLSMFFLLSMT